MAAGRCRERGDEHERDGTQREVRHAVLREQHDEDQVAEQERCEADDELVDGGHQRDVAFQAQRERDHGGGHLPGG